MHPAAELFTEYQNRVVPALQKKRGYQNKHQVPKLVKVVVNTSIASAQDVKQALEIAKEDLALITGQAPIETIAKKSISNFKLRAGQSIGAKVTLRGRIMYEFLERLLKMALPRIRDFRGVSVKAFDGNGNYTLGISEQSIFPEVELDKIKRNIGFDITIVTSTNDDQEARDLLTELGMPFTGRNAAKKKIETSTATEEVATA